jgi:hypothetical protein
VIARILLLELLAPILAGALAAGCTHTVTVPERVSVEVPTPCVLMENVPPRPQLRTESDLMNMPRGERTLATWSERAKLEAYSIELEAIATGCSRLSAPAPP